MKQASLRDLRKQTDDLQTFNRVCWTLRQPAPPYHREPGSARFTPRIHVPARSTMTNFSRRNILGGAAAGSMFAAANAPGALAAGQHAQWGPAPPPLAGKDLPSFRYALGAQPPKQYDGGWAKEATVAEFPVSQTIAGVLMSLSAGARRELHWHPNAAEGGYGIQGRCRVPTIDPPSPSEVADFRS